MSYKITVILLGIACLLAPILSVFLEYGQDAEDESDVDQAFIEWFSSRSLAQIELSQMFVPVGFLIIAVGVMMP